MTDKEHVEMLRTVPTAELVRMLNHLAGDEAMPVQMFFRHLATRIQSMAADLARVRRETLEEAARVADAEAGGNAIAATEAVTFADRREAQMAARALQGLAARLRSLASTPEAP